MKVEELKTIRKSLKLTQAALGESINLSRVTIGQMERGQAKIEKRTELAVWCLLYESGCAMVGERTSLQRDSWK